MKLFYWIRYNLGKVFFILLIIWALVVGLKKFIPSLDSSRVKKSRPSSIDFRPKKERDFNRYKRRPRKKLKKLNRTKKLKTQTYIDPENEEQFTISDKTQAMLIEMKTELSEYGVQMEDLLMAIEIYFDNHKGKKKKEPSRSDLIKLLPSNLQELIPQAKAKNEKNNDNKETKVKKKTTSEDSGFGPNETVDKDGITRTNDKYLKGQIKTPQDAALENSYDMIEEEIPQEIDNTEAENFETEEVEAESNLNH